MGLVVYISIFHQSSRLIKVADRAKRPEAADVSSGYLLTRSVLANMAFIANYCQQVWNMTLNCMSGFVFAGYHWCSETWGGY